MATMKTIIIKNDSGSDQTITDLGITISDSSQITFSNEYDHHQIIASDDLRDLVSAGTLVVNDGSSDLSSANGLNYLYDDSKYERLESHYTKTELQNGSGTVHWDNLTNVPALGWSGVHEPVKYRVTGIQLATPPTSPDNLDVYIDNTDNYKSYNGSTWDNLGAASSGDRVIDLSNVEEDITEFDGVDTWTAESQALDGSFVSVDQDKDATSSSYINAQYVYDTTGTTWKLWARTDFSGHLNGEAGKHDASEIDIETSRTNLGITAPTDLESALGNTDTAVGNAQSAADAAQSDIDDHTDGTANKHDASEIDIETSRTTLGITAPTDLETALGNINTALGTWGLDEAYDEAAGSGAGRIINSDSGPVELNRGSSTDAPFRIVPKTSLPTTNLADGQIDAKDGMTWVYDGTRSLWLSTTRMQVAFGDNDNISSPRYIFTYGGTIVTSLSGVRMIRDAVITGISAQINASGTVDFKIRKNGTSTDILTLSLASTTGNQNAAINISLSAGDWLSCYVDPTGSIRGPVVTVEYAWRG